MKIKIISTMRSLRARALAVVLLGLATVAATPSQAQVPTSITNNIPPGLVNYQGQLLTPLNVPYSNGIYDIEFRLYPANSGALNTMVWGAAYKVFVNGGVFGVMLGSPGGVVLTNNPSAFAPTDLWKALWYNEASPNRDLYLGIRVLQDQNRNAIVNPSEAVPRQQLLVTPFAARAQQAEYARRAAGAFDVAGTLTATNNVVVRNIAASGSITTATARVTGALVSGAITATSINVSGNLAGSGTNLTGVAKLAGGNTFSANQTINGNVGINKSPSRTLDIFGTFGVTNSNGAFTYDGFSSSGGSVLLGQYVGAAANGPQLRFTRAIGGAYMDIGQDGSGNLVFENNDAEVMVVSTNGSVGMGTDTPQQKLEVVGNVRAQGYQVRTGTSGSYGANLYNWYWNGSQMRMYVDNVDLGQVTTTSDRRLKEGLQPLSGGAIERVLALKPTKYKYKTIPGEIFVGDDVEREGFVADELQAVIPSAVNGSPDGLTESGTIQPQTIDVLPLVSVLTKAIQEQQAQIEALRAQVNELQVRP